MSITRKLPRSIDERLSALRVADQKAGKVTETGGELVFSQNSYQKLKTIRSKFEKETQEKHDALVAQSDATQEKRAVLNRLTMFISHFIQGFNNAIGRKIFKVADRAYYGLDVNDDTVPVITKESDAVQWADNIIKGEKSRLENNGEPMAMPSADEVETAYNDLLAKDQTQSMLKDEYDKEQEDVEKLLDEVDHFIKFKIWDEVEFFFREDAAPSKRRKCREWGLVYVTDEGEILEDEADALLQ